MIGVKSVLSDQRPVLKIRSQEKVQSDLSDLYLRYRTEDLNFVFAC